jgi:hypothetical protein
LQVGIRSLGGLKTVGGNLNLRNVPIEDFGSLESAGGNVLLHKRLEGKLDLSRIRIAGRVKYFNDQKSRLDDIPERPSALAESEMSVPLWKKEYAFSVEILNSADARQKEFYRYFKESFLGGRIFDVRSNSNYVFVLMFDLIKDFRTHRDEELVRRQLVALGDAYPVIRRYTEENLADAIAGRAEKMSPGARLGITISSAFNETLEKARLEHPEIFGGLAGVERAMEFEDDEDEGEQGDDELDDVFEDDDELDVVNRFDFPPANPLYTVE